MKLADTNLIEKIIKKLSHETAEYAVRDITFLTCCIFTDTHRISMKEIFDFANFSIIFWYKRKDGNVVFYRYGQEYNSFSEKIGKGYLENIGLAKQVAGNLVRMSDEINRFIKNNTDSNDFTKKWDHFYKLYRDFFAYHQAVYWSSEYLLQIRDKSDQKDIIDKIVGIMDKAYKYNERVVPNVESYFIKLGLADLSCDEIKKNKPLTKSQNRSIMLLDNEVYVLSFSEASKINNAIEKDYEKFLGKIKDVVGLSASKGRVKGEARIIKDLNKLRLCKKGTVLITTQTRPQYNSQIKNVKAIVTDHGGLLCHASMLAREFGIPCIVGTKIATRVFKDGDLIEVDADKGVVRKVKE